MLPYVQNKTIPVHVLANKGLLSKPDFISKLKTDFDELEAFTNSENFSNRVPAEFKYNTSKDRYKDVLPDPRATNVKLSHFHNLNAQKTSNSYYINANYVKGFTFDYICTQYPLPQTTPDFWNMVHNENVSLIINLVDELTENLHPYWPVFQQEGLNSTRYSKYFVYKFESNAVGPKLLMRNGEIEIALKKEAPYPSSSNSFFAFSFGKNRSSAPTNSIMVRSLKITNRLSQKERVIAQIQFRDWQDKQGVSDFDSFKKLFSCFYHYLYEVNRSSKIKVLIHCKAGIGRTGTFVAIDSLLHKLFIQKINIAKMGSLDIVNEIITLRMQRVGMVQNFHQFKFIHGFLSYIISNDLIPENLKFSRFQIQQKEIADLESSDYSEESGWTPEV